MAHIPVNHPLRPVYRTIAGLTGLYVLIFGIAGTVATWGDPLFARDDVWVLGLRTNLAFSISSIVYGGLILIGAIIGGRAGHLANLTIAVVFMVTGLLMMALLQTDANFLNFSMSTVIVSLIFGLIFLATGLYDKVGPAEAAGDEERYRRGAHRPAEQARQ
ncbi:MULTISPECIES: DUF4383 domain-containing protein [unclassified Solwaraspora]|uniref:DUF4383 domain-containing protein n=1 Tax=unclassified Solwaraspora TaxID=2627926 RepID=UPI00248B074F|nr:MULTISPECIES: DUF4383 domain-containing protein [unclassified Solwaraspora]WBB97722.1 DUF4383 domain-containing protein [Solwaraspora sp. WMMA2059]WBC18387.1 DUF4383 domain-containing protein [Solwaraspora sp. WMMA2080]WJK34198.1 DUF4383 domain-containing protein [Solwaraspora sp. WMMA2065]